MTSLVSAYAGAKARQLRRDAVLFGFVCLMALMASAALFSAFALAVSETYGLIHGLLAAAGLALILALLAIGIRMLLRRRARRRMSADMAGRATTLAITSASTLIAQNKSTAIIAGLVIGAVAGTMMRSNND
jgi:O-antigen/teichoic acid export membrane protein|tara:strand:- start:796 stop:1191 length:396 start_codon:yes stop_codon:yes gene_type:complete